MRRRERPIDRDPETGKAKEPPPDTERAERRQFLATAKLKAANNYRRSYGSRDAYMATAMHNARIDWDRGKESERKRQARTESIDDMLNEPAAPDLLAAFDAFEAAMNILSRLPDRERTILNMMFVGSYSRTEVADALQVTPNAVSQARKTALHRLRESMR